MEELGSQWTDFHEIRYLNTFRISVEKIQVLLKSEKNNGYFVRRKIHIFDHLFLALLLMRNVSDRSCRENQNTRFMLYNFFWETAVR
jgi:hypothetical protein